MGSVPTAEALVGALQQRQLAQRGRRPPLGPGARGRHWPPPPASSSTPLPLGAAAAAPALRAASAALKASTGPSGSSRATETARRGSSRLHDGVGVVLRVVVGVGRLARTLLARGRGGGSWSRSVAERLSSSRISGTASLSLPSSCSCGVHLALRVFRVRLVVRDRQARRTGHCGREVPPGAGGRDEERVTPAAPGWRVRPPQAKPRAGASVSAAATASARFLTKACSPSDTAV